MFRTFLSVILAASIASIFPQSSSAETVSKTVSVSVYYGDLNLATDAGARTLLTRLNWAGRQVCGWRPPSGSAKSSMLHRTCMRETVSSAVAKLGSPTVTAQLMASR
jgi:UrcA family protein